jgi:predicted  nucleic acid-binding Zn-ribbon protein
MSDDRSRIDNLITNGIDKVEQKVSKVEDKVNDVELDLKELNSKFGSHEDFFQRHLEADERMYQEFTKMNSILRENTDSLREHMRRTSMLEESLLKINNRLTPIEDEHMRKKAIQNYMKDNKKRFIVYLGIASTIIGIIVGVTRLI